jgi:hypothetical protein
MRTVTIKCQHGPYRGTVSVNADEHDDNETIIAKAKNILRRRGNLSLPMAYESFKIVKDEEEK